MECMQEIIFSADELAYLLFSENENQVPQDFSLFAMAAKKLRPLREFGPSTSRGLLTLHRCRLAFLGLQNCLPRDAQ